MPYDDSDLSDLVEDSSDYWVAEWLDKTYGGAPDECSACFRDGKLTKIEDCKTH